MKKNSKRVKEAQLMKEAITFAAFVILAVIAGILIFGKSAKEESKENAEAAISAEAGMSSKENVSSDASTEDVSQNNLELLEKVNAVSTGYEYDTEDTEEYNGRDLEDNGATYAIKVNRQENIVTIYSLDEDGYYTVPVKAMCCSVSGEGNTPTGLFTTSDKYTWRYLKGDVYGQYAYRIYKGILFHSVPYTRQSKSSLETWEFNKLGTGASLGCVRLCVADAKWIYENCEKGTYVNIFDSDYYGPMGKPQPAYTFEDTESTGWDPTDMTSGNPFAETAAIYGAVSHSIEVGEPFNARAGVLAFNSNLENVTDNLIISGSVDNNIAGEYEITYSFWDNGEKISKEIVITVEDDCAPVITMAPETMHITGYNGDTADLAEFIAEYITAYDGEISITETTDEEVTENPEAPVIYINLENVETTAGEYTVECTAYDAAGNTSEKIEIELIIEE